MNRQTLVTGGGSGTSRMAASCGGRQLASSAALQRSGALTGTSAFAFQGTNAHALVKAAAAADTASSTYVAVATPSTWSVGVKARHWLTPPPHRLLRRVSMLNDVIPGPGPVPGLRPGTVYADVAVFHAEIGSSSAAASLLDHRVSGSGLLPGAAFLELAHSALRLAVGSGGGGKSGGGGGGGNHGDDTTLAVLGVVITSPLHFTEKGRRNSRDGDGYGDGGIGGGGSCGAEIRVTSASGGKLEITPLGGGRRCMTASFGRFVISAPPPRCLNYSTDGERYPGEAARRLTTRLAAAHACDVHGDDTAAARGSPGVPKMIAALINQPAATEADGLQTSPAALDASFQSVSATWSLAASDPPPILRVPASFDAFVVVGGGGGGGGGPSSAAAASRIFSRNEVRECVGTARTPAAAAHSQHALGAAVVRGMTAKPMRRPSAAAAAEDIVTTTVARESSSRTRHQQQRRRRRPNLADLETSAVIVQHQTTPQSLSAAACRRGGANSVDRHRRASWSTGSTIKGVSRTTSAVVARSLACAYQGATCDAAFGLHFAASAAATATAAAASDVVGDYMTTGGIMGAARAIAMELGDERRVTSERIVSSRSSYTAVFSPADDKSSVEVEVHAEMTTAPQPGDQLDIGGSGGAVSIPRAIAVSSPHSSRLPIGVDPDSLATESSPRGGPVTAALWFLLNEPGIEAVKDSSYAGGASRGHLPTDAPLVVKARRRHLFIAARAASSSEDSFSQSTLTSAAAFSSPRVAPSPSPTPSPNPSPSPLAGKHVIITGGTGALGTAMATHATRSWGSPVTLAGAGDCSLTYSLESKAYKLIGTKRFE